MNGQSRILIRSTLFAALALLTARTFAQGPIMIRLRPVVEVTPSEVRLADIANISAADSTDAPDDLASAGLDDLGEKWG